METKKKKIKKTPISTPKCELSINLSESWIIHTFGEREKMMILQLTLYQENWFDQKLKWEPRN